MSGGSKKQTVGYHYRWAMHFGWCGPVDAFLEFRAGGMTAWKGRVTQSAQIQINEPNLWGGESAEGGISGSYIDQLLGMGARMDVMFGEATQAPNDYLAATFGAQQSGHRGKLTTVFRGGRFGAYIPNPKPVSAKVERIFADWRGGIAWYPQTARIPMVQTQSLALYFAIDLSGSMDTVTSNGFSRLANMKTAVNAALDFIDDVVLPQGADVDIMIVGFGTQPGTRQSTQERGVDSAGIASLKSWVSSRSSSLWTYFPAGLIDMDAFFADAPEASLHLTFFITDGEPSTSDSSMTPLQIAESAKVFVDAQAGLSSYAINIDLADTTYTAYVDNTPEDAVPVVAGNDPSAMTSIIVGALSGLYGMNPAHMLYDSLVHDDMQGEPMGIINEASFQAAADQLYSEGFGLCTHYDSDTETPEQFQQRICNVIGAALTQSRIDGQYYLDLIRADHDVESLPIIGEDDLLEFRQDPSVTTETVNMVRIEWFDPQAKEERITSPLYAMGNIQSSGQQSPQTRVYHEIPTEPLALRVGKRDLKAASTPLNRFELAVRRKHRNLRPGRAFRLQASSEGIADMVCIVGSIAHGTHRDGRVKIVAVQDVYSLPSTVHVQPAPGEWQPPNATPIASPHQIAVEAPYIELVTALSNADLTALPADAGYLLTVATRPSNGLNYAIYTAAAGEEYEQRAQADWCPTAVIVEAAQRLDTVFTLTSEQLLDRVAVGTWALWGTEIVRVDSLDAEAGTIELGRGCADTPPVPHAAGERIYFCADWVGTDQREYVDAETVSAKLLARTASKEQPLATAAVLTVVMDQRAVRPYPPGNLMVNGEPYPAQVADDLALSWSHRDRILQADQLIDTTAGDIGPEPGVTYTVRLYSDTNALIDEDAGIGGASHSIAPPASSGTYTLEVVSVRDGYEQFLPLRHTFNFDVGLPDDVLAASILSKLRHYYAMNETSGTRLKDSYGGADLVLLNTGNINYGGATIRTGGGGTMRFTSTGRASMNGVPYWQWSQDNYSLFLWYKPDAQTGAQRALVCNAPASDTSEAVNITFRATFASADGMPEFFWEHGVGTDDPITGFGTTATTTAGHAAAFVRDSALTAVRYFHNGIAAGSATYANQPTGGNATTNEFTVGNMEDQDRPAQGYLQDVMLLKGVLTADEIKYLYNGGSGKSLTEIRTDAGVATNTWTPVELDNKVVWVRSDDPDHTVVSNKITHLYNRTGLGAGLIYAGNGAKSNSTTLNSRPVLTADGTDTGEYVFNCTAQNTKAMPGITIVAAYKMRTADGGSPTLKTLIGVNRGGADGFRADLSNSSSSVANNIRQGGRRLDGDAYNSVHDNTDHGTNWLITVGENNYTTGFAQIYVNGLSLVNTSVFATGTSSNTNGSDGIMLGRYIAGNVHANYELAEMLVIADNLTTPERQKLEGYLAHQWGLTANLDVSHPYKAAPPTV